MRVSARFGPDEYQMRASICLDDLRSRHWYGSSEIAPCPRAALHPQRLGIAIAPYTASETTGPTYGAEETAPAGPDVGRPVKLDTRLDVPRWHEKLMRWDPKRP